MPSLSLSIVSRRISEIVDLPADSRSTPTISARFMSGSRSTSRIGVSPFSMKCLARRTVKLVFPVPPLPMTAIRSNGVTR